MFFFLFKKKSARNELVDPATMRATKNVYINLITKNKTYLLKLFTK